MCCREHLHTSENCKRENKSQVVLKKTYFLGQMGSADKTSSGSAPGFPTLLK